MVFLFLGFSALNVYLSVVVFEVTGTTQPGPVESYWSGVVGKHEDNFCLHKLGFGIGTGGSVESLDTSKETRRECIRTPIS